MSKSINPMRLFSFGGKPFRLRPRSHRLDEFAASYSLAGCSPALPASASPAGLHFQATERNLSTVPLDLKDRSRQNINHQGWAKLDDRSGPGRMIELSCSCGGCGGRRLVVGSTQAGAD